MFYSEEGGVFTGNMYVPYKEKHGQDIYFCLNVREV